MARLHTAKLPACEKELKKSLSCEGKHQEQNVDSDVIELGGKWGGGDGPAPESSRT
jgi:hypothetical protein